MTDLLEDIQAQMYERILVLDAEIREINEARQALKAINGEKPKASGRPGRPQGSGGTQQRIMKLLRDRPGLTIPEIAEAMGRNSSYFYRALPTMEQQGRVRSTTGKDGKVIWSYGERAS